MIQPDPNWPDPLGHNTVPFCSHIDGDEPQWVDPQTYWRNGKFIGKMRGSIPDQGDCERHPELPPGAYALKRIYIYPPDREAKFHFPKRKIPFDRPEGSWGVTITYLQARKHGYPTVELFSTRLGPEPIEQVWKVTRGRHERKWAEFFESRSAAIGFVQEHTGLQVPNHD